MLYKGKIAPWYWGIVLIYNAGPLCLLPSLMDSFWLTISIMGFYYLLGDSLMIPFIVRNKIVLKQDTFIYYFGFSHKEYKIRDIRSMSHSHSILASSACSLDRIVIDFGNDEMCASLQDNDGFLNTLKLRNPAIHYDIGKVQKEKKQGRIGGRTIISIGIVLCVAVMSYIGSLSTTLEKQQIVVDVSVWPGDTIAYEDIARVVYREDLQLGKRTGGFGNFKMKAGNFRNEEFGNYTLYAFADCKAYVILYLDKDVIVLNERNKEKTKQLYEDIQQRLDR